MRFLTSADHGLEHVNRINTGDAHALVVSPLIGFTTSTAVLTTAMVLFSHVG